MKIPFPLFCTTLTLIAITIPLTGCQVMQKSAKELRSTIDQTVTNVQDKANNVKTGITDKVNQVQTGVEKVKTQVDQTKEAIDQKVQQFNEATDTNQTDDSTVK